MTKIHPNEDFFTNLTTRAVLRRHFQLQKAANKKETDNTTDTGTKLTGVLDDFGD